MDTIRLEPTDLCSETPNNSFPNSLLEKLYAAKYAQLARLGSEKGSLRFLVLQAEMDAIRQEIRQLGLK